MQYQIYSLLSYINISYYHTKIYLAIIQKSPYERAAFYMPFHRDQYHFYLNDSLILEYVSLNSFFNTLSNNSFNIGISLLKVFQIDL